MKTSRIHIMIEPDFLQSLDAHCQGRNIPRADAIRQGIALFMGETKTAPDWNDMERSQKVELVSRMLGAGVTTAQIASVFNSDEPIIRTFLRRHKLI